MKKRGYMPPSKSQTHITPDRVFEMIESKWGYTKDELYDPCPADTPYKAPCFFNGLYGNWQPYNYVNCPYEVKTLTKFVEKAVIQSLDDKKTIMLLPVKTDQDWFHDSIVQYEFEILWIRKRLKFKNDKDSSMSSHFLVMIN